MYGVDLLVVESWAVTLEDVGMNRISANIF